MTKFSHQPAELNLGKQPEVSRSVLPSVPKSLLIFSKGAKPSAETTFSSLSHALRMTGFAFHKL